ncbi:MAG TPA: membrane protein insertase YidC [Acidimicrobiales bacterium]|nr:membrane protein insertase YidC [Acidimicrobiales bacterium]
MHLAVLVGENSLFKAVGEIFHPLFVAIADVLAWIYGVVPTYAAAIVLLTVLIMALMTPLTIKSTRSMLAMQSLQPELQKLRTKYKGAENRQQLNEEMMKLYREHNVSPTGGCLPMFLQMPAFIVLYDVIRGLANTVKHGTKLGTGLKICHAATVCPTPRYVPHTSAIYHNLVKTPGVMHSIGLNLAARPLTHRANWFDYIPYFALLAVAVALQYFQMAQMTRRNKKNNTQQQMPQQMQTMQRFMPLIFAYIYFLVPAGVVIYMIVSSAIRVLTQDLIFRHGLVQAPGERQVGKARPAPPAIDARSSTGPKSSGPAAPAAPGERRLLPFGGRRDGAPEEPPVQNGGSGANGRARAGKRGNTAGATPPAPKPHPRSKSKRERKAR